MNDLVDHPRGASPYPRVRVIDETMREGMQIESADITTEQKISLLNELSATGLEDIVVGSFVSPRWVPQMADIDAIVEGFEPAPGVTYRALTMNEQGRQRLARHVPPLSVPEGHERHRTRVHLCETFLRRNANTTPQREIDSWPGIVERAGADGAGAASIGLNAAWGSNWAGSFSLAQRTDLLQRQHAMWERAGIPVTNVWLGDPMGWNTPTAVREQLTDITARWPTITSFHLHLHNTRGLALLSAWEAVNSLGPEHELVVDTSIGGIGGCPYCGNGQATGMIDTADFVHLLQQLGLPVRASLPRLIRLTIRMEELLGRSLDSHVSRAGPLPVEEHERYGEDLTKVETFRQAQHFLDSLT